MVPLALIGIYLVRAIALFISMYGMSWEDASRYDVTINLEHFNVENASAALTSIAQLPDFQMTPASGKAMVTKSQTRRPSM